MNAVVLGGADRDQDNVVLTALLHCDVARRVLDVGAALAKFGLCRQTVVLEDLVDLLNACLPDTLFQQAAAGVLKLDARVIGHPPGLAHDFLFVGLSRHDLSLLFWNF